VLEEDKRIIFSTAVRVNKNETHGVKV
jgi:hypothetical protein